MNNHHVALLPHITTCIRFHLMHKGIILKKSHLTTQSTGFLLTWSTGTHHHTMFVHLTLGTIQLLGPFVGHHRSVMSRPFQGASDLAHRLVDLPDSGAPFIPLKDPSCLRITKVAQVLSACHSEEVQKSKCSWVISKTKIAVDNDTKRMVLNTFARSQ